MSKKKHGKKKARAEGALLQFPAWPPTRRPIISRSPCWGGIETVDYNFSPPRVTRQPRGRR